MKTLQEQYNLIKEGKGHKGIFLTEAKKQFPSMLTNPMGFEEASKILKTRGVLSEGYVDLKPINTFEASPKQSWENKFAQFLAEEAKSVEKKTTKEVEDIQAQGYNYKDKSNLDNQIGQEVLNGIYFEGRENPDKSLDELRKIVSKNLAKDGQYYMKNAAFGVKGLGYQEAEMMEVSGKHKSSGYSDKLKKLVKESLSENPNDSIGEIDTNVPKAKSKKPNPKSLDSELSEIDTQAGIVAMEAKLGKIDSMIQEKSQRLTMIDEDINLSELVDKSKIKSIQKEIKILEKMKSKMEKIYEKMTGKVHTKTNINEASDFDGSGLVVTGKTQIDNNKISDMVEETDLYGVWNTREGYWFFPEEEETFDALEEELEREFFKREINARFESQIQENLNPKKSHLASLEKMGYSRSDIEDFLDEWSQGGSKLPPKVKDYLDGLYQNRIDKLKTEPLRR